MTKVTKRKNSSGYSFFGNPISKQTAQFVMIIGIVGFLLNGVWLLFTLLSLASYISYMSKIMEEGIGVTTSPFAGNTMTYYLVIMLVQFILLIFFWYMIKTGKPSKFRI
ncbi:MAG: hypothetical protein ACOCUI_00515 [bacterium]